MSTTLVDEEFRRRLRLIMQQFGSVADLARAVGVSDNAIYKWVSGRGQPSMMSLVNLSKAAGVSVEWLATGRGAPTKAQSEFSATESPTEAPSRGHSLRTTGRPGGDSESANRGLSELPAGLAAARAQPGFAQYCAGRGDRRSDVADDRRRRRRTGRYARGAVSHDGVYVLRTGSDLAVKRLQRQPNGSILIRSDNPAYESYPVRAEEVSVLGRALWVGGRL